MVPEQVDDGQKEPLLAVFSGHQLPELSLTSPRPALALLRLHYLCGGDRQVSFRLYVGSPKSGKEKPTTGFCCSSTLRQDTKMVM